MKQGIKTGGFKESVRKMAVAKERIEKYLLAPDENKLNEVKFFIPEQTVRDSRRQKRS